MCQKNAVLRCNWKSGKSERFYTKRKSGGKTPQIRPSPKQNRSESQCSCIFQGRMKSCKQAYMGLSVKYALGKSSCPKITPVLSKNRRITVSLFLSTLQLSALRLKSFRLRLHCYTRQWLDSWLFEIVLLQNIVSFIGLFCKRDQCLKGAY